MATGRGRIVPTLDELTAQCGSRLEATGERVRYFEGLRPPEIDQAPPVEGMATLYTRPDVSSDDLLDVAAGVKVLFVGGRLTHRGPPFELRRPHPNIEGLIACANVDAGTMAMLPNLRFLQIAWDAVQPDLQAAFPSSLEEIWVDDPNLVELSRLPRLTYLRTRLRSGRAAQSRALAELPELRALHLEMLEALRGANALGRLANLEDFSVNSVSHLDFKALSGARRLKHLGLGGLGSTKTLDGIERLEALEGVGIGGRRCPPISPLAGVANLTSLSIGSLQAPPDVEVVGKMTRLRSLSLSIGSVSSPHRLKSAALFGELELLEGLDCLALLEDQDLTPLARLKHLRYLCFYGTFPEEAVRWLQDRLPDCKLDLTVGTPPPARTQIHAGSLTASREGDGTWSVWQDLRLILAYEDNHAAEDAVRAELKRTNPALLERVVFDSESDGFAARVKTREDLDQLAAAVAALTTGAD